MRIVHTSSQRIGVIFSTFVLLVAAAPNQAKQANIPAPPTQPVAQIDETPAQQRIRAAQQQLKADPKKVQVINDLALAYIRRARESADDAYLNDAEAAIAQGLKIDPRDFQLQKSQVVLMLSRHQFPEARERATVLNRQTPDDVLTYGYIAEADIALGKYDEAESSVQWMLNLRRNNIPGLLLGAKLRALYGDPEGAIEFLNMALQETSPTEMEDLAWIMNQIASIQIDTGKTGSTGQLLDRAEQTFPNYSPTIENRAKLLIAERRFQDAVILLKKLSQIDRDPHIVYLLATAEQAAGQIGDAHAAFEEFERLAANSKEPFQQATLDLILHYASDPADAPKALKLAQQEIEKRSDVWTEDAYGWALYANGKCQEAASSVQKAIAVGVQSAQIFNHAGHIAQKLDQKEVAEKNFELALQANPSSPFADDARAAIGRPVPAAPSITKPQPTETQIALAVSTVNNDATPVALPNMTSLPAFSAVPADLLTPRATETDRMIRSAQSKVAANPNDAQGYAYLGAAYFQRARETGDVADYELAEKALNKSLDLVSSDFSADDALGTLAEVCMGEHRFADAIVYAQKALSLGSGDVSPFAIIGDAYADMGEYEKAAQAYARLTPRDMTLAPRAAYARDSRLSYLKFIQGDMAGAIRLMKISVVEGTEAKIPSENLAWLYYELAEYETQAGDVAAADAAYLSALTIHPGDYRALAGLGKLRANQGKYAEAIVLYQKAIAIVPMPIFVAELGDLFTKSGNPVEAKKQYQLVEYIGLLGKINQVLHNRDLAIFYADHDMKLAEGLELAQKELEVRHDVYTWDAVAWALYKNGKYDEAAKASEKALKFGTRDALLLFHAGMIAERLGRHDEARLDLKQALQINPQFHLVYASAAQKQLALLAAQSTSSESHAR